MNQKKIIWISVVIFSFVFGLIPKIWGADLLSFDSLIFNGIGGIVGIWIGYKISQEL